MTSMDDRPIKPAQALPTEAAMPPAEGSGRQGGYIQWAPQPRPAPIRFDRVELDAALTPVVAAIVHLGEVVESMRPALVRIGSMGPALARIGEELSRVAQAAEQAEDQAMMEPRRRRR